MARPVFPPLHKLTNLTALSLLLGSLSASADTPPTPGSVRELVPGARLQAPPTPAQVLLPEQPGPLLHDRNGRRFQVHSFRFQGNTAFPTARLKRVVDRYLDLEVNLYDLNVAADAVTEFYHDRGYTLARAVIPPQKVIDGVVTIAIVEGRIGKVLFSGQKRYGERFLREHTQVLAEGELVTSDKLERSLLLLNDMPGLQARATLSPGSEFGLSDVLVKVEEQPISFNATVDNAGRRETGQSRLNTSVAFNNPLGFGDQLSLTALVTNQYLMKYAKLGYSVPLNGDGLRLNAAVSDLHYDVSGAFAALGLSGTAQSDEISLQYPTVRSRGSNESWSLGFRDTLLKQSAFDVRISSVRIGLGTLGYQRSDIGDDASVSNFSAQFASNLKKNSDGLKQNAEMGRLELDGNILQPIDRLWDVYVRGNLVFSNDTLPDSEKFSIGGPDSVRAYQPSELRGDSGIQGTLELRRRLSVFSMLSSVSFFADSGRVVYKAPGFRDSWDSLSGVGTGFTLYPTANTAFKIEVATPAGGRFHASDGERGRLWASLSISF